MKIAILVDELIQGGFQKVALMEAKYFKKLGHEVLLISFIKPTKGSYEDIIQKSNIDIIYLEDYLPKFLRINFKIPFFAFLSFFHFYYPFLLPYYYKKIKGYDYYLIHGTYTFFVPFFAQLFNKIPLVTFVHDSASYIMGQKYNYSLLGKNKIFFYLAKIVDKFILTFSKKIVTYPEMATFLNNQFNINNSKFIIIQNGVEVADIILNKKETFSEKNFIAATKWDPGKNLKLLFNIWYKFHIKNKINIIGTFVPDTLKIQSLEKLEQLKLNKIINIMGKVKEQELYDNYENAFCLVHPCREAFGMTILEAASRGCPSIFTENSGVSELFDKSFEVFKVIENDEESYYNAIKEILNLTYKDYMNFCNKFYKVAQENSWEKHCSLIVENI